MFKNYFKTAFRSLRRNKGYSFINIFGLASGIAVCVLIYMVIQFEQSFENFHQKKERIYRVLTEYHHADANVFYGPGVPTPLPNAIRKSIPQIEKVATVFTQGNDQILVLNNEGLPVKKFKEEKGVFFSEPSLFSIFDFPFLAGNAETALNAPNKAVITQKIAEKYFGNWENAIGKNIKWNNSEVLNITGVLADIPANTDLQIKIVVSLGTGYSANFAKSTDWDGTGSGFGCYVLLSPGASASVVSSQIAAYSKKLQVPENKDSRVLQAMTKVHFDANTGNFSGKKISPELIRALWLIAMFILFIACVNFVNLSTAQAVNRAKEIGVRKVLGSNRYQLRTQFIVETLLIVLSAICAAIVVIVIVLPAIGRVLDLPINLNLLLNTKTVLFVVALAIAVTLLAGFYPSLVLSGFNPINALKTKLSKSNNKGISLRRALVIFQFIVAQALIIGTFIMVKQMNYFTSMPLGFNKDAIVNIPFPGDSAGISKLDFLKKKLEEVQGIQKISFSSNTPVEDDDDNWSTINFDHSVKSTDFYAILKWTDDSYVPTYQLPLVAGRNLERSDTIREFLVNESLVKNLGIKNPNDILNKEIAMWDGRFKGIVVGVLKDFHDRSFRRDLAPLLMTTFKRGYSQVGMKLSTSDMHATMDAVGKIWDQVFPDFVYEYQFLDLKIENFYKQENKLSSLYKIFAVIAILLSCLGLYGLASFMAAQRLKEVGVRKVLGATAANIVYLFSKEFIVLIGIAFVIATPLAWYFMKNWLQDYPFRIQMSWWIFLLGGLGALLIALLTISSQAIKAAITNPVNTLRSE